MPVVLFKCRLVLPLPAKRRFWHRCWVPRPVASKAPAWRRPRSIIAKVDPGRPRSVFCWVTKVDLGRDLTPGRSRSRSGPTPVLLVVVVVFGLLLL